MTIDTTYLDADSDNIKPARSAIRDMADFCNNLEVAGAVTGAAIVAFQPSGTGAAPTTAQAKLRESPSVTDRGAVGNGVTVNTTAFANMEADTTFESFYVPDGVFLSGAAYLKKHYFGPGAVLHTNGSGIAGTLSGLAMPKTTGLSGVNSGSGIGIRSDIFIGDSITFGFGVNNYQAWPYLLQKFANNIAAFGQGSFQTGGMLDKLTIGGTVTFGTAGPVKNSYIMTPGSTLTFTADYVDYFTFWYQQTPGSGTITLKQGASTIRAVSCAGAAANDVMAALGSNINGDTAQTYSLTCSGANVEITGVFASAEIGDSESNPCFLQVQAHSGYATSDFTSAAVIASIKAQAVYGAYFPRYIIALGANDIYNPSKAVSSAAYKANLISIITQIGATSSAFVLTVPLRAGNSTYAPVLEPFDNYRKAVYEVARQYSLDVVDLSELDLKSTGSYQADDLHPNYFGHAQLADFWFKKLYATMYAAPRSAAIVLTNGAVAAGGSYALPKVVMAKNGVVAAQGSINVVGIAKGTTIGSIPPAYAPTATRMFCSPTLLSTGSAILLVDKTGAVSLYDYTAASVSYVSFDCITYSIL